jgi:hypothetical protein
VTNPTSWKGYLSNYQPFDMTKKLAAQTAQKNEEPVETWAQFNSIFYRICLNNAKSCVFTGADVITYLAVSALRHIGFCLPPLQFPQLSIPRDNVDFISNSIKRATWTWKNEEKKVLEMEIAEFLGEEYEIFQVVGEFSIAYAYESLKQRGKEIFIPNFLTTSEPLENDQTFNSVGKRFAKLNEKDQQNVLKSIYNQKEEVLTGEAKAVYVDIRGLASKFSQGNEGYLKAFTAYNKAKESEKGPSLSTTASSNQSEVETVPLYPSLYPEGPQPSAPPFENTYDHTYDQYSNFVRNAHQPLPSAPPLNPNYPYAPYVNYNHY